MVAMQVALLLALAATLMVDACDEADAVEADEHDEANSAPPVATVSRDAPREFGRELHEDVIAALERLLSPFRRP